MPSSYPSTTGPAGRTARLPNRVGVVDAVRQFALVVAVSLPAILLSVVHAAPAARLVFPACALAAAWQERRRSPFAYVTLTLWFWSLSPFVRRVIDASGGFTVVNPVLITPNLLCAFMLWEIARSPALLRRRGAALGAIAVAAVGVGLALSFAHGDIVPGLIAAADWICPLAYFLFFLVHADRIADAEAPMRAFVPLNLLVVSLYGLAQYLNPLPWDARWVLDSQMQSVGVPLPFGLKPFSTLNGPGLCAVWLGGLVLLSLCFRNRASLVALPAGILLLGVTLVRSVIGGTLLGIVFAVVLGQGRMLRAGLLLLATIAVAGGIVTTLDPRVSDALLHRFDSIHDLQDDESARARAELYAQAPGLIAAHPIGLGIGALGRGAVASNNDQLATVDSGPLAIYLALGWFAGSAYILAMLGTVATAVLMALRSRTPAALALAAVALSGGSSLLFTNVLGLQGVMVWLSAGYAIALGAPVARARAVAPARHAASARTA